MADPLALVCAVFCDFVSFLYGILALVVYRFLILANPFCHLKEIAFFGHMVRRLLGGNFFGRDLF